MHCMQHSYVALLLVPIYRVCYLQEWIEEASNYVFECEYTLLGIQECSSYEWERRRMYVFLFNTLLLTIAHIKVAVTMNLLLFLYLLTFVRTNEAIYDV